MKTTTLLTLVGLTAVPFMAFAQDTSTSTTTKRGGTYHENRNTQPDLRTNNNQDLRRNMNQDLRGGMNQDLRQNMNQDLRPAAGSPAATAPAPGPKP